MSRTRVALFGSGFVAEIHMESYRRFVPEAEVVAVCSRDRGKVETFARTHGIPAAYTDAERLLEEIECDVADICMPNFLHAGLCVAAAKAGRHVIVEKPLCMTLEEADEMIEVCRANGRKLMYAEQLCFAPKYERVRGLISEGAIGDVYMLKQSEKHSGPHSDWFWDVDRSGGGVLMDMGCHAIGWFRWMLGGSPAVKSVWANLSTVLHKQRTRGEDNAITVIEFENGVLGVAEDSWARHGGMDDRIEVYGTDGVSFADLFTGNAALTYSRKGYGYALEKGGETKGWTFTVFEEAFNQGYPHELCHFIECVREDRQPAVTGEDGRAVLEIIYAAYESARTRSAVTLPFRPRVSRPIDLWLGGS